MSVDKWILFSSDVRMNGTGGFTITPTPTPMIQALDLSQLKGASDLKTLQGRYSRQQIPFTPVGSMPTPMDFKISGVNGAIVIYRIADTNLVFQPDLSNALKIKEDPKGVIQPLGLADEDTALVFAMGNEYATQATFTLGVIMKQKLGSVNCETPIDIDPGGEGQGDGDEGGGSWPP